MSAIPSRQYIVLVLIIIPLVIFGPAIRYGFVGWDDDIHVYNNRYLKSLSFKNVSHFWISVHEGMYIPVTFTAWALLAAFSRLVSGGFNPAVFHNANLIVHLANVLILYGILRCLLSGAGGGGDSERREWAAALGALLFAVHPLQAEPVIWISSLKDLLCGFFSLLCLRNYLYYARAVSINRSNPALNRRQRKRYALWATVSFIPAILAKPAAVILPVLAWLAVRYRWDEKELSGESNPLRGMLRAPTGLLLAWIGLALPVMVMAKTAEKDIPLGFIASFPERIPIALDALAFYLSKLLLPFGLGIDYGRTPTVVLDQGWVCYTWIFPVFLTGFLCLLRSRRRWLIPLGIFAVGVLPTLGLVPHGYQVFSTVADRFLYLSMIGPALALAWIFLSGRRPGMIVTVLILFFFTAVSFFQSRTWSENRRLFQRAIEVNPRSYMAWYNLGLTRAGEGDKGGAEAAYRKAIAVKPDYGRAYNNLGAVLTEQGKYLQAIEYYREAFRLEPGNRRAFFNYYMAHDDLGNRLAARGELAAAADHYRKAVEINPGYAEGFNNLGAVLARTGKKSEAEECFLRALEINSGFEPARRNLNVIRRSSPGRLSE